MLSTVGQKNSDWLSKRGVRPPEVVEETQANLALREEEEAQMKAALARLEEI